jgi:outer membrane protein assembly factor BamB
LLQVRRPHAIIVLETETGRHRGEFRQGPDDESWARDPVALDDDRIALVDDRAITLFDVNRGASAWTYREIASLPRSGPPRLLVDGGRLLALRDGSELVRLDPATGLKLWSRVLGLDDLSEAPAALALDAENVYVTCAETLTAYNLADGSVAWRRALVGPRAGWSLALAERCIAVYPDPARSADGDLDPLLLLFCRRDDGRLLQRLVFPSPAARVAVRLATPSAMVATQSGAWSLGPWMAMDASSQAK